VRELLAEGKGVKEIARLLAVSPSTVSHHESRLGYPPQRKCALRYDWGAIQAYYSLGYTRRQCQERFGFTASSWSDAVDRGDITPRPYGMPLAHLLARRPRSRYNIKQRLIAAGIKRSRCEYCGLDRWRGSPLSLPLHHVNGDRHERLAA